MLLRKQIIILLGLFIFLCFFSPRGSNADWKEDSQVPLEKIRKEDLDYSKLEIQDWIQGEVYSSINDELVLDNEILYLKVLFNVQPRCLYRVNYSGDISLICFNEVKEFIGMAQDVSKLWGEWSNDRIFLIPDGSNYVGINVSDMKEDDTLFFEKIGKKGLGCVQSPYNDNGRYIFLKDIWANGNGVFSATKRLSSIVLPNLKKGKLFVSNNTTYNCILFDERGRCISNGGVYEQIKLAGRIYDIPENACVAVINLFNEHISGIDGTMTDYAVYIPEGCQDNKLCGKRVAAIGDSITWLDGRLPENNQNRDGSAVMRGWQAWLRMRGAYVVSFGYSGEPYADGFFENGGIWRRVVQSGIDVDGYDIVILFAGANDVKMNVTIDSISKGSQVNMDERSFTGSIGGIIQYIRDRNPNCQIVLCTTTPAGAENRTWANNKKYRDAILRCGELWKVPVIDLFYAWEHYPSLEHSQYCYDTIHPNIRGMEVLGKMIADVLEDQIIVGN